MAGPHHIIPGEDFTREGWDRLKPKVDELAETPGGILMISVEVAPATRNWPDVGFHIFTPAERKAIAAAIRKARKPKVAKC